jgi:hypothetical protein
MREVPRYEMVLALEKLLAPAAAHPAQPHIGEPDHRLEIAVVFTSVPATLGALKEAGALADRLAARITLVVPQIVPYPLPLTSPPVLLEFNERRFFLIASQSRVETTVRIYLCRDRQEALAAVLKPHSLIVIGGRKRWWPTAERRLARRLRRAGHEVIVVEAE